jgi:hypothetical protein
LQLERETQKILEEKRAKLEKEKALKMQLQQKKQELEKIKQKKPKARVNDIDESYMNLMGFDDTTVAKKTSKEVSSDILEAIN